MQMKQSEENRQGRLNKFGKAEFHFRTFCPSELRWQETKSTLMCKGLEVDITIRNVKDDWTLACARLWLKFTSASPNGDDFNFFW